MGDVRIRLLFIFTLNSQSTYLSKKIKDINFPITIILRINIFLIINLTSYSKSLSNG